LLVNSDPVLNMTRGASAASKNKLANSGGTTNTGSLTFNLNINTEGVCLDVARMYHHFKGNFDITITNNNATGGTVDSGSPLLAVGDNFSLGPYPLNSMYSAGTNMLINEQQICNYDVSTYGDMVLRLQDQQKINQEGFFPSYPELTYAHSGDAYLTPSNPSGSYADSDLSTVKNGSFGVTINSYKIGNTVTAGSTLPADLAVGSSVVVNVGVELYEPFNFAPCSLSQESVGGMYYVRTALINLVLNNFNRVFRFGPSQTENCSITPAGRNGLTVNSVVLAEIDLSELNYLTYSPPLLEGFSLPKKSVYHTYNLFCNNVIGSAWEAGATGSQDISLTNQNVSGCPRYMIIGVKQNSKSYDATDANWYYPITKLIITEGNNQNLLASYNQVDLYNCNRRNGSKQSYPSFIGSANSITYNADGSLKPVSSIQTSSGPVILELGKDLPLPFNVVPSSSGNMNFTITATAYNSLVNGTTNAITPALHVVFLWDSWFVTDAITKESRLYQNFLTSSEVMGATAIKSESEVMEDSNSMVGGALHKMKHNKGVPSNIGKSAVSRRIVH